MKLRKPVVASLGGGLDSWTMLLEGVRRGERIDVAAFVDVGHPDDPGEWPGTYEHIMSVVAPFCETHGIELVIIDHEKYPVRDARSLFAWLWARKQIPVTGYDRICTTIAKVERFEAWLDDRYAGQEVEVWIGFEAGEEARAAKDPNQGSPRAATYMRPRTLNGSRKQSARNVLHNSFLWARAMAFAMRTARRCNRFPLMEWGLCRCRCEQIARDSGYPVPRKSACVFCPYATKGDWQTLAVELPETFEIVAQLEERKPPTTENHIKLSIMDFRDGRGTPLREFVAKPYTRQQKPCKVCGAAVRATKATGCGYLADNQAAS